MGDVEHQALIAQTLDDIEARFGAEREGSVLGVAGVCAQAYTDKSNVPPPPWFEDRRRLVVWDDHRAPEVQAYLTRYWTFQQDFREASDAWLEGDDAVVFPQGAFKPGRRPGWRPVRNRRSPGHRFNRSVGRNYPNLGRMQI